MNRLIAGVGIIAGYSAYLRGLKTLYDFYDGNVPLIIPASVILGLIPVSMVYNAYDKKEKD